MSVFIPFLPFLKWKLRQLLSRRVHCLRCSWYLIWYCIFSLKCQICSSRILYQFTDVFRCANFSLHLLIDHFYLVLQNDQPKSIAVKGKIILYLHLVLNCNPLDVAHFDDVIGLRMLGLKAQYLIILAAVMLLTNLLKNPSCMMALAEAAPSLKVNRALIF